MVVMVVGGTTLGAVQFPPRLDEEAAPTPVPILLNQRSPIDSHGGYSFRVKTGNGISHSESRTASRHGKMITKGSYSFHHPDGTVHDLSYTADENGFHPSSDLLPTPFPLEPWQEEQVRFAEKERRLKALRDALKN
ncbi:hypothetical protein Pmani_009515 [Petrolisthes manimaculis]|uniref:Uncharacterized protein n=1 Tax=Petrolisthes manimaculis TaxID=1843537 RepID=A0AAE1Q3D7_9EUCA|nr:hypothetical protein Pmani_009515 [Petrolisthes manimaculis]